MLTTHHLLSAEVYKKSRAVPLLSLRACAAYDGVKRTEVLQACFPLGGDDSSNLKVQSAPSSEKPVSTKLYGVTSQTNLFFIVTPVEPQIAHKTLRLLITVPFSLSVFVDMKVVKSLIFLIDARVFIWLRNKSRINILLYRRQTGIVIERDHYAKMSIKTWSKHYVTQNKKVQSIQKRKLK